MKCTAALSAFSNVYNYRDYTHFLSRGAHIPACPAAPLLLVRAVHAGRLQWDSFLLMGCLPREWYHESVAPVVAEREAA